MSAFWALAVNGFREARRNRVTVIVGIFAVALILASSLLTGTVVSTFARVLTDVGLGTMAIILALLAIFLSSGLLSREIERRTIFLVVSKPVTRGTFLLARAAGNVLTLTFLLVLMAAIYWVMIKVGGLEFTRSQAVAIGMLWFELVVLTSVGFLISSFSSQMLSAFVTTALYFAGHLSEDLYNLAAKAPTELLGGVAKGVYYLLPHLGRLNYRTQATFELYAPASELLSAGAYALAYSGVLLMGAVLLFSRRDFK